MAETSWHLVLLHGFLGAPADWVPVAAALPPGWTTACPSLPGHDAEPLPPEADLPRLAVDRLLEATRDAPASARVAWVGYSMGGRILLHALGEGMPPPRVLILCSAAPGIADPADRSARVASDHRWAQRIRTDWDGFLDAWYAQPLFGSLADRPDIRPAIHARRATLAPRADDLARVITACSPGHLPERSGVIAERADRIAWIAGEEDPAYAARVQAAGRLYPGLFARTVPHAGHTVHLEQPAALAAIIEAWLRRTHR